ncbi:tetratricopeptide repeat protein [Steroidobacter sp. S1-65]|uniref:Tetratricopeptide repeat protein n=1 Tax=Steroidobacter gossypii TaxID=2805490 RepID=A0ABS1WRC3_9GAMM|nr:tetratricopeptide repeat protein [Steroidobacter gossypii]MBM0103522.1 tetratricopeptide repeat protein [Steroidobacter gossypii]
MSASVIAATELAQVTNLLRQGKLAEAESSCRNMLTKAPGNAAAIHLLGLIRKDRGDTADGERLLRESIALAPRQPDFKANLANLLRRTGRPKLAETLYREALQLDRNQPGARVGLIRALSDQGEHVAAESEARTLLAANQRDSTAWSLLAMTLREQMRLPEAEQAYRRAIEVAPNQPQAHHNLGSLLNRMDRAEEALQALERAQSLGLSGLELVFNRGVALTQLLRLDEAERAFEQAVALNPLHGEAQVNLARVRFMRGDPDFSRSIAAAANKRSDPNLQILLSLILRRAGDLPRAESTLRDVILRSGTSPEACAALAEVLLESGQLKEAETHALEAAGARPNDARFSDVLVTILLSRGRPQDALPFIQRQRAQNPLGQTWLAYEATAARMLGDPLYQELYDYDRLVRTYDIEAPIGWSSMQELNDALLHALNQRHPFSNHPLDQSLRNGSQTARNLLVESDPAIRAILEIFKLPLQDYQQRIGADPNHPLTARNQGAVDIVGAWSVQLRREGYHVNHVHPDGWISSAYYVAVPEEVQDETLMSGWLKFGEPRFAVPGATPEAVIQPRPGRLVLFPSYMWHGTNPIHGSDPRTTIAFDAVPRKPTT